MKGLIPGILVLFLTVSTSAAVAQETDNLRVFAYEPICSDYVLGYSIDLMAEGRLVGHPEKTCNLNVDYSECSTTLSTTLCRVRVQLREWQSCVEEKAKEKLDTTCSWFAESAPLDTPVGSVSVAPNGSGLVAEKCFSEAVAALRERMTILLSPSISPNEQQMALSFNDQLITSLKTHNEQTSSIVCGHYMNIAPSFPDLPTAKALRIALLTSRAAGENRENLFAILRLAFETDRTGINLSRESWFSCFTDLEVEFFVFRAPLDDLISEFEQTCDLFLDEETRADALQDFEEIRILRR